MEPIPDHLKFNDPLWGELNMGFFDPCPLHVLAEAMRDGKWLDMRTEDGVIQRVRIVEIIVRTQGDDVVLRQEWLTGRDRDEFYKQQFAIDAESIWKIAPTNYRIAAVRPYGSPDGERPAVKGQPATERETEIIVDTVVKGGIFLFQIAAKDWNAATRGGKGDWHVINKRHATVLVLFEMTDLDPSECCKRMGWKSQQPLITAKWKATPQKHRDPQEAKDFQGDVRSLGKLVDDQLAPHKYRRQGFYGRDYTPVLP